MNSLKYVPRMNCDHTETFDDPIVKEVRDARHILAAQWGNDLARLGKDLIARQQMLGHRLRHPRGLAPPSVSAR